MPQRIKSNTIANLLLEKIESGEYPHNGVLPPETELAAMFHAARNTVRKAIAQLAEQGIILKSQGRMSRINFPAARRRRPERFLAWMWYMSPAGMTENIIYFEMFKTMVEFARDADLDLRMFYIGSNSKLPEAIFNDPRYVGFFAVGAARHTVGSEILEKLKNIPNLIAIDEADEQTGACTVSIDNYASGRLAACHLLGECGYRRIMIVHTSGEESFPFRERIRGFCDTAAEFADSTVDINVLPLLQASEESAIARQKLLQRARHQIDAIFCLTDLTALNMLECANSLAINVPCDLGIMGFDNIYAAEHVTPRLTTIAQPNGKVIKKALELALGIYNSPGTSLPKSVKFPGTLVYGQTTAVSGKLPHDHLV